MNEANCERIERCFRALYGEPTATFPRLGRISSGPMWRIKNEEQNRRFIFSAPVGEQFLRWAPDKVPSPEFFSHLTHKQLDLFVDVSLAADGTIGPHQTHLAQVNPAGADAFALACILAGRPISAHRDRKDGNGPSVSLRRRSYSKPYRNGLHLTERETRVWCPTIEGTSSWLAKRGHTIYFTGNSGTPGGVMDDNYGIDKYIDWRKRHAWIKRGITEMTRILDPTGGVLIVKCMDQVCASRYRWQAREFAEHAESLGLRLVDTAHVQSYRPQPGNRPQVHFHRGYSTALILTSHRRKW